MITTFTGKFVNPLELRYDQICIEDIAHSLALLNRFVGHTRLPISVAQHSVMASRMLSHTSHALQGLLHDGSEAYLGDVSRMVKASPIMSQYRYVEEKVQGTIYMKFGANLQMHPEVLKVDNLLAGLEGEWGIENWEYHLKRLKNSSFTVDIVDRQRWLHLGGGEEWSWKEAEQKFLEAFERLCPHS